MADHHYSSDFDDYVMLDVIGNGATAVVNKAQFKPGGPHDFVAIKRINLEKNGPTLEELRKEIQVMVQCNHPNVVRYYTSFVKANELWVVMQLCTAGSLLDIIKHRMKTGSCKNGVFEESAIATLLKEVLNGLDYIHSGGHIHRDIKAGNILLSADGSVRIADMGVAAVLKGSFDSKDNVRHTFVGTPCWMAPEVMEQVYQNSSERKGYSYHVDIWSIGILAIEIATGMPPYHSYSPYKTSGYSFKADIWSLGITAIELATGTAPYHKHHPMKVIMLTLQNDPPTLDSNVEEKDQYKHYSKTFRKMIASCLKKDPEERPTAKQLLKNDFFSKKARDKQMIVQSVLSNLGPISGSSKPNQQQQSSSSAFEFGLITPIPVNTAAIGRRVSEGQVGLITLPLKITKRCSGKMVKTPDGEWVWSDDENSDEDDEVGRLLQKPPLKEQENGSEGSTLPKVGEEGSDQDDDEEGSETEEEGEDLIHLVLRVRNEAGVLNDIQFSFDPASDEPGAVANEMVQGQLIPVKDEEIVASNLSKIISNIANRKDGYCVTFRLVDDAQPQQGNGGEYPDEKNLYGFAQIKVGRTNGAAAEGSADPGAER